MCMERYTILQFNEDFPDEEACLGYVAAMVYPSFPLMPCRVCEVERTHHKLKARKAYSCQKCGTHIYPLAGTIFEKSRTPLKSWFYAMYLVASTRSGISAKQLERELGVTYKTAWRMFKQIRTLMADDQGPLTGTVEADETFFGGKPRYRQGDGDDRPRDEYGRIKRGPRARNRPDAKKPIVGMVERGGSVKAWVTPDVKTRTIQPLMTEHVLPATMVYTDEARQYGLVSRNGYGHRRIQHKARIYVDGDVHTNTIEGFWSLLKNGVRGVYHSVGNGYLQSYVDEYTFRYNHRNDRAPMFTAIAERVKAVRAGQYGDYAPVGER